MTPLAARPAPVPRAVAGASPNARPNRRLRNLFCDRVPEVADGVVQIVSIARDPGACAKVAVYSCVPGVNADGVCIGWRGQRVRDIESRLAGESITIVRFDADPCRFVVNALRVPVFSASVTAGARRRITVVVENPYFRRALGKEGRNVRLAAKLTGWAITVCTHTCTAGGHRHAAAVQAR